ncbi:MAG: hypothetical protein II314_01500, partial [Prevotella sp.]|nr:hypothetical protein [Prevotella sp.]
GLEKRGLYLDETIMRMCYTHKRLFATLAANLINEGDKARAKKVLEYMNQVMPEYNVPTNYFSGGMDIAGCYILLGMKKEAVRIISGMWKEAVQYMHWYNDMTPSRFAMSQQECVTQIYIMQRLYELAVDADKKLAEQYVDEFTNVVGAYQARGGQLPE